MFSRFYIYSKFYSDCNYFDKWKDIDDFFILNNLRISNESVIMHTILTRKNILARGTKFTIDDTLFFLINQRETYWVLKIYIAMVIILRIIKRIR